MFVTMKFANVFRMKFLTTKMHIFYNIVLTLNIRYFLQWTFFNNVFFRLFFTM